ncbi:PASTA domain-containing protein [Streptomyces sp. 15-116A]|uniref:PASTA domain-containing protein n=1 Tax=Streptomyces sp. 15-116A TaxID=2259035 RepID=UPI0021B3BF1E|nr:PASTA domain-containing protein [Streptomyces sp. 15-116A]MCT7356006.1 PASTA domain-containing protein [Streptomyces sp. 15-116A]
MRIRYTIGALTAAVLFTLTACEGTEATGTSKPDTADQKTDDQATADTEPGTDTETTESDTADDADAGTAETAELPDLVGLDLQAAQDEAQAAGFYVLDDQDASGQNRLQVLDRNWTVCSQEPEAGTHPTDTQVTLFAVKDTESC